MAVVSFHTVNYASMIAHYEADLVPREDETDETFAKRADYALAQIDGGTFDAARDTWRGEKRGDGAEFTRLHADTVGCTVKVAARSTYIGDGDSHYWGQAVVANADGTYRTMACGYGGWYAVDLLGSAVDATSEMIAAYEAHIANEERLAAIRRQNDKAYDMDKGSTVIVRRGRKVAHGTCGVVVWYGVDDWGKDRVGIRTDAGQVVYTAAYNCDVIPEPDTD